MLEVTGDHSAAFQYALEHLQYQGFKIKTQRHPFEVLLERGSRQGTIWLGIIIGNRLFLRLDVRAYANGANLVIVVTPGTTGWAAGGWGYARTKAHYQEVMTNIGIAFSAAGTLVGTYQTD